MICISLYKNVLEWVGPLMQKYRSAPYPHFHNIHFRSPLFMGGGDRVVNSLLLCRDGWPQDRGSVIKRGPRNMFML